MGGKGKSILSSITPHSRYNTSAVQLEEATVPSVLLAIKATPLYCKNVTKKSDCKNQMKRSCHVRRLDTRGNLWKGFSQRSGRASVSWSALSLYFIKIPLSTTGYGRDPIPWWGTERESLQIRQKRKRSLKNKRIRRRTTEYSVA